MLGLDETMRYLLDETVRKAVREELSAVRLSLAAPRVESARVATLETTFTAAQVAEHLKKDASTVRGWLAQGRMQGSKATGHWLVTASQLAAFRAQEKARTAKATSANTDEEAARLLGSLLKD